MIVVEQPDAAAFLAATTFYRGREPLWTNLIGSIAEGVRQGRRYAGETWLTVEEAGEVVGAAVRTAPYNLLLGPMPEAGAVAVGRFMAARGDDLPGVAGPEPVVMAALGELGRPWRMYMRDILRALDVLIPPSEPPAGSMRPATSADGPLLADWHRAFLVEAGLPVADEEVGAPRLEPGGGALWVWEVEGEPAAMAGHAPIVDTPAGTVGRIGPVYTALSFRRRGIGAALTAGVATELLGQCDRVMLFADADNATSNGVYERLGFVTMGEQVEISLL